MKRSVILASAFVLLFGSRGTDSIEARHALRCSPGSFPILYQGAGDFECGVPMKKCKPTARGSSTYRCPSERPSGRAGPASEQKKAVMRRVQRDLRSARERRKVARASRKNMRRPPAPTPLPSPLPLEATQPNQLATPTLPLPVLKATSTFLLLGSKSGFLASIEVTPQDEPVHVRKVSITLVDPIASLMHFELSDDIGFVLGNATRDLTASSAGDVYTLNLSPANAYAIERRDTIVLGLRAVTKEKDAGGLSAETLQVEDIDVTATGLWTDKSNLVSTSGPDFQKHQTANAVLRKIENRGKEENTFTTGSSKVIGSFVFEADQSSDADPALSSLSFSVSTPNEVSLSNVLLRDPSGGSSQNCSVASGTITCSSIADSLGSLQSPRLLDLVADVTLTGSHPDPYLQIELNTPGRPGSAGAISWTDGDSTFTWVPLDPPIVQGTLWK